MSEVIRLKLYENQDRTFPFVKTEYFCMFCGKQSVWEDDCDDFYQGTGLFCTSCLSNWQNCMSRVNDETAIKLAELTKS